MTDETVLAPEAGPEVVTESPENQVEGEQPETGEAAEPAKSAAKERREREKQAKQRLWEEKSQAEERAQEAEAKAARLEQVLKGKTPPKESDFPDPIEFAAVKAAFLSRADLTNDQVQEARDEAKAAREAIGRLSEAERQLAAQSWTIQVDEAKGRYADFEQVAFTAPISVDVSDLILGSEVGTDIAYHLGKNHELARQISAMPPIEAARAIGRLEATLTARPAQPQTNAPPPINPVRGGTPSGKNPDNMTFAEFKAFRDRGGKI